jgi:hypothetical protein
MNDRRPTGTVWIAWDPFDGRYTGYQDAAPDARPAFLEQMPETTDLHAALQWARERSDRIVVRPEHDWGTHYWAGTVDPSPGARDWPRLGPSGEPIE